jgi:hypothetical protein
MNDCIELLGDTALKIVALPFRFGLVDDANARDRRDPRSAPGSVGFVNSMNGGESMA